VPRAEKEGKFKLSNWSWKPEVG